MVLFASFFLDDFASFFLDDSLLPVRMQLSPSLCLPASKCEMLLPRPVPKSLARNGTPFAGFRSKGLHVEYDMAEYPGQSERAYRRLSLFYRHRTSTRDYRHRHGLSTSTWTVDMQHTTPWESMGGSGMCLKSKHQAHMSSLSFSRKASLSAGNLSRADAR